MTGVIQAYSDESRLTKFADGAIESPFINQRITSPRGGYFAYQEFGRSDSFFHNLSDSWISFCNRKKKVRRVEKIDG